MRQYGIGISVLGLAGLLSIAECSDNDPRTGAEPAVKPAITGADKAHDGQAAPVTVDTGLPPLPIEQTGNVAELPRSYPESWIMVDDASFSSMFGGKVIVIDAAERFAAKQIKGLVDKNLLGNFAQSKTRGEFYVLESFHERGSRGPKIDVLVIYDKATLSIQKELVWTESVRLTALPERYAVSLSRDEQFLFAANFDPASSITVIDLDAREIVGNIGTPGCVLAYPAGDRRVASLCSDGSMLTTTIDDDGRLGSQSRLGPFFDPIDEPIFEHAVFVDDVAYFPSFKGLLHGVDFSAEQARYLGHWDMLSDADRRGNWRPSGLVLNDVDDAGRMYTIFQPDGKEGTQTHGGTQVWVFDLKAKKRVQVIEMAGWAISVAVTRGTDPLLVVTNGELNLDVFSATSGDYVHTISDFGNVTPLLLNKSY